MQFSDEAIKNSTSLTVLIISSVFVVTALSSHVEERYLLLSLFFFLYSIINHYLSVFSKIESIRTFARGGWRFWLFGFIFWWFFAMFVLGGVAILYSTRFFIECSYLRSSYLMGLIVLGFSIVVWIINIFVLWIKK